MYMKKIGINKCKNMCISATLLFLCYISPYSTRGSALTCACTVYTLYYVCMFSCVCMDVSIMNACVMHIKALYINVLYEHR